MNTVQLVGRAGQQPEVKYFESGKRLCKISLAVKGQMRDQTDWFELEIWGNTAQIVTDYVNKGNLLGVEGSFKVDTWEDRSTGEHRHKLILKVDRVELLEKKKEDQES